MTNISKSLLSGLSFLLCKMGTQIKLLLISGPSLKFCETASLSASILHPNTAGQSDCRWRSRTPWHAKRAPALPMPYFLAAQLPLLETGGLYKHPAVSSFQYHHDDLQYHHSLSIYTSSMFLIQFLILSKDFSFVMS